GGRHGAGRWHSGGGGSTARGGCARGVAVAPACAAARDEGSTEGAHAARATRCDGGLAPWWAHERGHAAPTSSTQIATPIAGFAIVPPSLPTAAPSAARRLWARLRASGPVASPTNAPAKAPSIAPISIPRIGTTGARSRAPSRPPTKAPIMPRRV